MTVFLNQELAALISKQRMETPFLEKMIESYDTRKLFKFLYMWGTVHEKYWMTVPQWLPSLYDIITFGPCYKYRK